MPNRAQRVFAQAQQRLDTDSCSALISAIGLPEDKASPAKQASYVRLLLLNLQETRGKDVCATVMRPCGHICISNHTIKQAQALYISCGGDMNLLLDKLNERNIGGGHLYLDDHRIMASYDRCYCGIARAAQDMPVVYCECSAGWYERLFSSVFEREVRVNILQTILAGQDKCAFEILL